MIGQVKNQYRMRISRMTVDKLGIKLYDKVSAAVAELVSNSYDADATLVQVTAPVGVYLASKAGGEVCDLNLEILVSDNGHGMTPDYPPPAPWASSGQASSPARPA